MKRVMWGFLFAALLVPLGASAEPLIAMRVELEALTTAGPDTVVAIVVDIAPEDRARVGKRALVQAELRRGQTTVDRVARTEDVSDDGEIRVEAHWPPGIYQLRVDVSGSTGDSSGFWVGTVTVPRLTAEPVTPSRPLEPPVEPAGAPPAPTEEAVAPPLPAEPLSEPTAAPRGEDVTEWGSDDPALATLTVVATDRNRPVLGLDRDHVQVRVDGNDAPIEAFGDATTAPLFLAVAVDVSTTMRTELPELSRQLGKLALTTLDHGGRLALVTADAEAVPVLGWDEGSAAAMAEALTKTGSAAEGDLAGMVTTSLALFSGQRGRRYLLVVTDGGDTAPRSAWKDAADAADGAGVPVMVVGLEGEDMANRLRRSLEQLADATGGRSYFLNTPDVLALTLSYMAELIDGSYALQVRVGSPTELHKIKLTMPGTDYELYFPRQVR